MTFLQSDIRDVTISEDYAAIAANSDWKRLGISRKKKEKERRNLPPLLKRRRSLERQFDALDYIARRMERFILVGILDMGGKLESSLLLNHGRFNWRPAM